MKLNFQDVIGKYKGRPAIAPAHGPSLNTVTDRLHEIHSEDYVVVGINDWYFFHAYLVPKYVVIANGVYSIANQHQTMNKYQGTTVVYADSVDGTDRAAVDRLLTCDYLPYDQRHFNSKPCGCKDCVCTRLKLEPGRKTIQEELMAYTGYKGHYGSGDTGALHQIVLAVLMGCNPIYFVGVDLDYRKGFAKNTGGKTPATVEIGALFDYRARILADLAIIRDSASLIGTTIVNLDQNSWYDVFEKGCIV